MSDTGVQSSYSFYPKTAMPGMLADLGNKRVLSFLNPNVALYIGCLAVRDSSDGEAKHPTAASDISDMAKVLGVVLQANDLESSVSDGLAAHYPVNSCVNLLNSGIVWVQPEDSPTNDSLVYVRYATGIADNTKVQKGAFRSSPDGTAQVSTLTPTAVNSTVYSIEIRDQNNFIIGAASYTSDSSATATEIVAGLKAALGTVPGVALSGTVTLILTASVAGIPFTVVTDPNQAIVASTASAASAGLLVGAKWMAGVNSDGFAPLKIG
jgi:hypothetical protein